MGAVRGTLAVVLAFLLQRGLLAWFPVWGVSPWLLPSVVCLLGLFQGADRGAGYGLLGGFLCLFSGASPWVLALLPLAGGVAGAVFPRRRGFWGNWLRTGAVLAGWEILLVLGHWLTGAALTACLRIAGPELLLSAALFPLAALLVGREKKRTQGF